LGHKIFFNEQDVLLEFQVYLPEQIHWFYERIELFKNEMKWASIVKQKPYENEKKRKREKYWKNFFGMQNFIKEKI